MAPSSNLAPRLRDAASAMAALRPDVEAGSPWPLSDAFGVEPEAHWGPPEALAHVTEMLPYWSGEIERLLTGPSGAPVPFGRVATNPLRLGVIERDRTLPARELFARIESDARRIAARLQDLAAEDLDRRGLHPVRGEMTVAQVAEQFVVGHLEEHVAQLRSILAAPEAAG